MSRNIKQKEKKACPAKLQRSRGFTLIELLVSIALFSIVVVVVLGAITSIVDANKKARSLMTVMNNLNFAVDSMTRSFNTGQNPLGNPSGCNTGFQTTEVYYRNVGTVADLNSGTDKTRVVQYCLENVSGKGVIMKKVSGGAPSQLTSPDVDIKFASFGVDTTGQPKLLINLEGDVTYGGRVSSSFNIQNTVTQKKLKLN